MEALQAMSGLAVMVIAVLAVIIVILGLALWKHRTPVQELQVLRGGAELAWTSLGTMGTTFEDAARTEAEKLLSRAEQWLTDTTAEDAKIAEHQQGIVNEQKIKASKAAMRKLHIEKLQALSSGS